MNGRSTKVKKHSKMDPSNFVNYPNYNSYYPGFGTENNAAASFNNGYNNANNIYHQQQNFTGQQNVPYMGNNVAEDWRASNPLYSNSQMTEAAASSFLPSSNTSGAAPGNANEIPAWPGFSDLISPPPTSNKRSGGSQQHHSNAESTRGMSSTDRHPSYFPVATTPYGAPYLPNAIQTMNSQYPSGIQRENISGLLQQMIASKGGLGNAQQTPFAAPSPGALEQFARGSSNFPHGFPYIGKGNEYVSPGRHREKSDVGKHSSVIHDPKASGMHGYKEKDYHQSQDPRQSGSYVFPDESGNNVSSIHKRKKSTPSKRQSKEVFNAMDLSSYPKNVGLEEPSCSFGNNYTPFLQRPEGTNARRNSAKDSTPNNYQSNFCDREVAVGNRHQEDTSTTTKSGKKRKNNSEGPECDICHRKFYDNATMKRHRANVHKLKGDTPSKPQNTSPSGTSPPKKKTNGPKCYICLKTFYDGGTLKRHLTNVHKLNKDQEPPQAPVAPAPPPKPTNPNKNKSMCTLCQKAFYDSGNLRRHLKTVHKITDLATISTLLRKSRNFKSEGGEGEDEEGLELGDTSGEYEKFETEECLICHETFQGESMLQKHIKLAHSNNGGQFLQPPEIQGLEMRDDQLFPSKRNDSRKRSSSSSFGGGGDTVEDILYQKYHLKQLKVFLTKSGEEGEDEEEDAGDQSKTIETKAFESDNFRSFPAATVEGETAPAIIFSKNDSTEHIENKTDNVHFPNQTPDETEKRSPFLGSFVDGVPELDKEAVVVPGPSRQVQQENMPSPARELETPPKESVILNNGSEEGRLPEAQNEHPTFGPNSANIPASPEPNDDERETAKDSSNSKPKKKKKKLAEKYQLVKKSRRKSIDSADVFQCQLCDKSYTVKKSLVRHLVDNHNMKKLRQKDFGSLKCIFCQQEYVGKYCDTSLRRHMRTRHKEEWKEMKGRLAIQSKPVESDREGEGQEEAPRLARNESGDSNSDSDIEQLLSPEEYSKLFLKCLRELGHEECPICDDYIEATEFQAHLTSHEVTCYICGCEGLKINQEFAEHCSTHNVGAACEIDGCDFIATSSLELWEHANAKHSFIYPYICIECGGSFASDFELTTHKNEVHNAEGENVNEEGAETE